AEAERIAQSVRKAMGLRSIDPMDSVGLARHVAAEVRRADELVDLAKLEALEAIQPGAFSAATFHVNDRRVVVYSPVASDGRRQSDIAHEVAHLLLAHRVNEVRRVGELSLFTCDPDEEQEANWLAGCLLLPRQLLLRAAKAGLDARGIAVRYRVSEQMAAFRIRATGVIRQMNADPRTGLSTR